MIFYDHIKAIARNTSGTSNPTVWTQLTWPRYANTEIPSTSATAFNSKYFPSLKIKDATTWIDLGNILTQKINTSIAGKWDFSKSLEVGEILSVGDDVRSRQSILLYSGSATLDDVKASVSDKNVGFYQVVNSSGTFKIGYRVADKTKSPTSYFELNATATTPTLWINASCTIGTTNVNRALNVYGAMWGYSLTTTGAIACDSLSVTSNASITGDASITGAASVGTNLSIGGEITAVDAIACSGKCEAEYFNATSDKRAKENLNLVTTSALDLIKKVQLYTFSYKHDSEHKTNLGLMAQDLIDERINDFSFVSNAEASGENGDFMSIKESKLVYLLIKAVQEQQEEIEQLRLQIQNLGGKK